MGVPERLERLYGLGVDPCRAWRLGLASDQRLHRLVQAFVV
jgi:hypothetical protein